MEIRIIEILSLVTKLSVDELTKSRTVEKLWDSYAMLEIVIALEDEFDISLEPDEIAQMTSVDNVINLISGKVNEA
ncbi:MAG: acyl carrier protein [Ruminobacter sp.]|nr:acyl carrier protein [Ruminobacter sp.]